MTLTKKTPVIAIELPTTINTKIPNLNWASYM